MKLIQVDTDGVGCVRSVCLSAMSISLLMALLFVHFIAIFDLSFNDIITFCQTFASISMAAWIGKSRIRTIA